MKGRHTETEILSPVTLLMDVKVGGIIMSFFIDLQLCNNLNNGTQGKISLSLTHTFLLSLGLNLSCITGMTKYKK